jgi:hypothetical protein
MSRMASKLIILKQSGYFSFTFSKAKSLFFICQLLFYLIYFKIRYLTALLLNMTRNYKTHN